MAVPVRTVPKSSVDVRELAERAKAARGIPNEFHSRILCALSSIFKLTGSDATD